MIFRARGYEILCCGQTLSTPSFVDQLDDNVVSVECPDCHTKMEISLKVIPASPLKYLRFDGDPIRTRYLEASDVKATSKSVNEYFHAGDPIGYPRRPYTSDDTDDIIAKTLQRHRERLKAISNEANEVAKKLDGEE